MKGNQEPMLYTTNATVAALNHVPGFDPLKFLRRTISRKTGEDVMRLDLRYKKLWFRLACPTGRLKLNALRITEKMAIFEAKVYRDREDAEPLSSYVANCTLDATPGGLYVEAAQEEALDTALSNAGFGIQFADVGSESEEYGSEVPVGAKVEIAKPVQVKTADAKPVQTKVEVAEPVQKQPETVKTAPQEPVKADPLDAIMADDMPVPEQVTAEVVEKPKTVVRESVQPAQTPAEQPQNVIVLEQEPPAAAYKAGAKCPRYPAGDTPDLLAAALHAAADTHAQSASAVTAARVDRIPDCKVRTQINPACVSVPRLCRASAAAWLHLAGRTGLLSRRCRAVDDQLRQPHGGHLAPGCRFRWSDLRYADTAGHTAAPQG